MARAERGAGEPGGGESGGVHGAASDARLTELLRADTPRSYPALRELRGRHRPAVLAYARLCTVDESAARQLTAQAFALAARDTAQGAEPSTPWRHQLLLLTGRVAAFWAADARGVRLAPALLAHLSGAGPEGPVPPMLAAFQALPPRVQGLVWYGVVEREPVDRTAVFLGLTREDVAYGTGPALQALRTSCLATRLAASADPDCQDFRRLIEESVHPEKPRYSADLHAHMATCGHCAAAHEELSALRDAAPRVALGEGLLPWSGAAYVGSTSHGEAEGIAVPRGTGPAWLSRRLVLASAALGVALAPLLVFLLASGGSQPESAGNAVGTPTSAPAVTVTATVPTSPSPSATSKSPKPTKSSKPSATPRPTSPKPTPTAHPPNASYAQVVNVATGRCLDILDGDLSKGTDVITAPCDSSGTQRWRVDASRGVVQSYADPDFCLDSRGSTTKGVGIWECVSVDGPNGKNLTFTVDNDGVIHPAVNPDTAVTPDDGDTLTFRLDQGRTDQEWRAGAS